VNLPRILDRHRIALKKLALRAAIVLLLLFSLSCMAAVTSSFNPFSGGESASQHKSIAGQDILLITFTLTLGHCIIDFISPDPGDPILHQIDRVATWVLGCISLRHKGRDTLCSLFQSTKGLAILATHTCQRNWHHTKQILSYLLTVTISMLSNIFTGLNPIFKILTNIPPKIAFWIIPGIAQVICLSLYSNLQLLYQCPTNLVEQRTRPPTHVNYSPLVIAAEATNNADIRAGETGAISINAKGAAPRSKTLAELIRESRAADELESRKQIEEAKWKQLDKVNQVTDLALEMVRQGKTREYLWARG